MECCPCCLCCTLSLASPPSFPAPNPRRCSSLNVCRRDNILRGGAIERRGGPGWARSSPGFHHVGAGGFRADCVFGCDRDALRSGPRPLCSVGGGASSVGVHAVLNCGFVCFRGTCTSESSAREKRHRQQATHVAECDLDPDDSCENTLLGIFSHVSIDVQLSPQTHWGRVHTSARVCIVALSSV